MARRVRKFVSCEFIKTVDLNLFRRFLSPFSARIGIDWPSLPEDEAERREALFEIFRRAEDFPDELQKALHRATILSGSAGAGILLEQAAMAGVELVPAAEVKDVAAIDTRQIALRAYLDHPELFRRAVDLTRLWTVSRPLERCGARPRVLSRHGDFLW